MITTVSGPLETGTGGKETGVLEVNNGDGNGVAWNKYHALPKTEQLMRAQPRH